MYAGIIQRVRCVVVIGPKFRWLEIFLLRNTKEAGSVDEKSLGQKASFDKLFAIANVLPL
jgi:hypothetical protein